ncbi:MAG: ArsR family transcriptional regulator [Thermococci archaeon]|nr:ArsR family transcriptional regulator [Thermococci archaeon]
MIYAVLLMNCRPMTISELSEATELSRSSVSSSLSRLRRDYFVSERKRGKTKIFTANPMFFEKLLLQPKELLEKEIKPLRSITQEIMKENHGLTGERKEKIQRLLDDLRKVECALRKIIALEEESLEC